MSGGHFDYIQHELPDVIDKMQALINSGNYSKEVAEKIEEGFRAVQLAKCFIYRIDWLASGDDGEETFLKRLDSDLDKIVESWWGGYKSE